MQPNIGWLFNKDLYNNLMGDSVSRDGSKMLKLPINDINWDFLKKDDSISTERKKQIQERNAIFLKNKTDKIEKQVFAPVTVDNSYLLDLQLDASQHFIVTTTYPGLLIGSGYQHESYAQGEYKLGFFFDHTTGLPVIPGSSVKGLLRSIFEHEEGKYDNRPMLAWLLHGMGCRNINVTINNNSSRKEITAQLNKPENLAFVTNLKLEIFEGTDTGGKLKNIYKRDTFFDAYITNSIGHGGRYLASDYITPHKHTNDRKLDSFANPTPIMFLKVLPEVEFCFQFKTHNGLLTAGDKITLFKQILLQKGIGAKTNVGYGQFK